LKNQPTMVGIINRACERSGPKISWSWAGVAGNDGAERERSVERAESAAHSLLTVGGDWRKRWSFCWRLP